MTEAAVPDYCVVKDDPEADVCRRPVFIHLTTDYSFGLDGYVDRQFSFRLPICVEHYERLIERYSTEFEEFSIAPEE